MTYLWQNTKKLLKRILKISHDWESKYTGMGYMEGAGFDFKIRRLKIMNISLITDVKIDVQSEWLNTITTNMIKRGRQNALFKEIMKKKLIKS
jgi:hypothetical protein